MASIYQTLADVFSDVRYMAGKDSTTLPDTDLFRIANKYYLWLLRQEVDVNEYLYGQISATDLILNQREYPLPIDDTTGLGAHPYGGGAYNILRVEISYDGGGTWYVGDGIDIGHFGPNPITLDSDLNKITNESSPQYWFYDRSLFIGPVPGAGDVTTPGNQGLRIWYIERPGEISVTSGIPDLPKEFLNILAEGMLIDVFRKYGRISDMRIAEDRFNKMFLEMRDLETGLDYENNPIFGVKRKIYS